jgi:hypothetical protein
MSKKIEKLKEVNISLNKRCAELETYMFIKNIVVESTKKINNDTQEMIFKIK